MAPARQGGWLAGADVTELWMHKLLLAGFSSLSNTLVQSRTGLSCDLLEIIIALLLISVNMNLGLWHKSVSQQAQLFGFKNTLSLNMNKCFIYDWVNSSFTVPLPIFLFFKFYLWHNWKKQTKLSLSPKNSTVLELQPTTQRTVETRLDPKQNNLIHY